ncbi:hypothetical protein AB4Z48_23360 [Cupriavidus sp. 2TAF22]|uniref:hypothetical protein n=1 Tax=unclassified Cupriavidus TaxID=2640874 RepID=UPI003F93536F
MNTHLIGQSLLQARLALFRNAAGTLVAAALCLAGALCWLWWVPLEQASVAQQHASLQRERMAQRIAQSAPKPAVPTSAQDRLALFYGALGDRRHIEQELLTLFDKARENGLVLAKADYKSVYDRHSRVYSYQILLPVNGSYAAIRRFCEKTLLAIPFASLDEITFRRDAIGSGTLEARLRFTLHLKDMPAAPAAAPEPVAAPAPVPAPGTIVAMQAQQP